jgi:osmotically inducible protein OsmC
LKQQGIVSRSKQRFCNTSDVFERVKSQSVESWPVTPAKGRPESNQESAMIQLERQRTTPRGGKVVYTARTHTIGGRENGASRSLDGRLDVKLSVPGAERIGTNPEQLFAVGWSACFESAIALAARKRKIVLPVDVAIDAEVDLHMADDGYYLSTRLNVSVPGIARDVAQALVDEADQVCPYSKATRGNIEVAINLV